MKIYLQLNPTNPFAFCSGVFGPIILPTIKFTMAAIIIAIRKFCAFTSHSMPTAHMKIITANALLQRMKIRLLYLKIGKRITNNTHIVPTMRTSLTPLSIIFKLYSSAENKRKICFNYGRKDGNLSI